MRHLLLVDDENNVLSALERGLLMRLRDTQVRIDRANDPTCALALASDRAFDVVISDYRMPQMSGVEFLTAFRKLQPDTVRLMLSASNDFDAVQCAVNQAEVFRYITKPWQLDELEAVVRLAFARREKMLEERRFADATRLVRGMMTPAEIEARRLEESEPGITHVRFTDDGSVLLDD
jgi:two-component system, probable response regulator PhcQ